MYGIAVIKRDRPKVLVLFIFYIIFNTISNQFCPALRSKNPLDQF